MCLASFVLSQWFQNMNHNSLQAPEIHIYFGRWCLGLHISHEWAASYQSWLRNVCVNEKIVQNVNMYMVYCELLIYGYSYFRQWPRQPFPSCFGTSEERLVAQLYTATLHSLQGASLLCRLLTWLKVWITVCYAFKCFKDTLAKFRHKHFFLFRKAQFTFICFLSCWVLSNPALIKLLLLQCDFHCLQAFILTKAPK